MISSCDPYANGDSVRNEREGREVETAPAFRVNDSPETTYYLCEGLIATGEVKSFMDKQKLEDAFEKITSVKLLRTELVELPKVPTHST